MSLRGRLVVGLLLVSATGLVLLGAITYAEQRSFLLDRIDDQLGDASAALGHQFAGDGDRGPIGARGGGFQPGRGPLGADPDGDAGRPDQFLPPGTYGQLRDASGHTVEHVVLNYGRDDQPRPDLSGQLPEGEPVTVASVGGSGLQYRALASAEAIGGGSIIAAVPLTDVDRTLDRLRLVEAIVVATVLLVLGVLGWFTVRVGLRPLERIGRTAGEIAGGDLERRVEPADERTEVGRLGLALNAMLERLEGAFAEREATEERLRTFISDASHELRTPLASIRGYAELYRMGAAASEEDTRKALSRIEEEAARMGVLVGDLLALARLDETREPDRAPVDLDQLAKDAVADAGVVDRSRRIDLQISGQGQVVGDESQLRQVLSNLMHNALIHTPPGSAIDASVGSTPGEVTFEVRDHGPGIPGEDPNAVFERFWRAEDGRGRGPGGSGLGLAIVAAIVDAHGGRVSGHNEEGGGAVFTVVLPRLVTDS
jgi:two-component system OmpR family sensor kinase